MVIEIRDKQKIDLKSNQVELKGVLASSITTCPSLEILTADKLTN